MRRVLIIGGGPSGSACAIELLKAGLEVIILERNAWHRHQPGETVHPGIEALLQRLDVLAFVENENFIRQKGICIVHNGIKTCMPYNEKEGWTGYQLPRNQFDAILLKKAVSMGARLIDNCTSIKLLTNDGYITGVNTNSGILRADLYIDATGAHAMLARRLNIGFTFTSKKLLVYYGYVHNHGKAPLYEDYSQMEWDDTGWIWISSVNRQTICWNRLMVNFTKLSTNWLPVALANYQIAPAKAKDVTWRIANRVSEKNYFMVGDAAFVLDPASSHGVLKAIMSGMMCGHLIKQIDDKNDIQNIHTYYNNWMRGWYFNDGDQLKQEYANKGIIL